MSGTVAGEVRCRSGAGGFVYTRQGQPHVATVFLLDVQEEMDRRVAAARLPGTLYPQADSRGSARARGAPRALQNPLNPPAAARVTARASFRFAGCPALALAACPVQCSPCAALTC